MTTAAVASRTVPVICPVADCASNIPVEPRSKQKIAPSRATCLIVESPFPTKFAGPDICLSSHLGEYWLRQIFQLRLSGASSTLAIAVFSGLSTWSRREKRHRVKQSAKPHRGLSVLINVNWRASYHLLGTKSNSSIWRVYLASSIWRRLSGGVYLASIWPVVYLACRCQVRSSNHLSVWVLAWLAQPCCLAWSARVNMWTAHVDGIA